MPYRPTEIAMGAQNVTENCGYICDSERQATTTWLLPQRRHDSHHGGNKSRLHAAKLCCRLTAPTPLLSVPIERFPKPYWNLHVSLCGDCIYSDCFSTFVSERGLYRCGSGAFELLQFHQFSSPKVLTAKIQTLCFVKSL